MALLKTSTRRKKNFTVFLSAVYSPWENLCIAQKQANASLRITGALRLFEPPSPYRAAFWRSLHSRCTSTITHCFILMLVPGTFPLLGTMSHERCKLFSAAFFLLFLAMFFFLLSEKVKKKKKSCGFNVLAEQKCVRTLWTHCPSSCTHTCSMATCRSLKAF